MTQPRGFLLVQAGGRRVGLPLEDVVGVTQVGVVYSVPVAEPAVRGVLAFEGRMVPVVSLAALLDGVPCPPTVATTGVIVALEGRRVCLEIDEAEIIVRDPALPVPPGETLPWAVGVARHPEGLVPVLDWSTLSSRLMEASA